MYKLSRIDETDIFFLAGDSVKLLGETLVTGTFQEVLAVAETLKDTAVDVGSGELVSIENPVLELTNITDARWFLLVLNGRYQIVRTSGAEVYSLPTNALEGSGQGSLESIFNKIIELEL